MVQRHNGVDRATSALPGSGDTTAQVLSALVAQAKSASGAEIAAFVVDSGVCVLVGGDGPAEATAISRAVSGRSIAHDRGTVAAPVILDGEVVGVLSAAAEFGGEAMAERVLFLAAMATARLRPPPPEIGTFPAGAPAGALAGDTSFRPLFDAAEFVLLVLDPEGVVRYANPFTERLTGFSVDDMIGRSVADTDLYSPAPTDRERRMHHRRVLDGLATTGEATIRIASGELRTFSFTLSPVRDHTDSLSRILASAVDVTERKAAEHRLHLVNDALQQARVQADSSAAARVDYLARMSHEIRTPLNAIIGATTLMLDDVVSDVDSEHTEILRSSSEHLLAVINDVLDITRMEADTSIRDDDAVFSVEALVESSLDLVMGKAAAKGLEVTSLIDPGTPPFLRGDAPRVRQVLVNLLSNAVKYTDDGVVEIIGRGHYVSSDRVELVFEITDTGPGIEAEQLGTLFDPFVRGDDPPAGVESTGLGLSICERLVHMLDGTISVQSTLDVGTRLTVSIPFGVHSADADSEADTIPDEFAGLSVLIVDDIELNRRVLELETRRWGMHPTVCASPLDALALVDGGRRFDVALLDFNMPEMNGDELAAQLAERNDIPRVLLSSTSIAGPPLFSACLNKPIKRHQLSRAIRQALGERPSPPAPQAGDSCSDRVFRILVAEDNVVNQRVADALLQRLGHRVTIVGDGKDVLDELERDRYDLVLLDLRMPTLGGIETAVEIIDRHGDARPRLVAFTASATEDDRRRCLEAGMDDFVTKPVTLDGLRRVVDDARQALGR